MLHVPTRFLSTTTAAVLLIAMLPGCSADETGVATGELGTAEQARGTELPFISPAAAAANRAPNPTMRAPRHSKPSDELFALVQGHWAGGCDIFVPGQEEPVQSVDMERISEPTQNPNEYTWTIIYRSPDFGDDVRRYSILATDTPGRYIIDEHNGIQLPTYLVDGNLLVSEFQAPSYDIRLFTREVFRGNTYEIEFTSVLMPPELTSVLPDDFTIDSFRVLSTQKCSLRRTGPRH